MARRTLDTQEKALWGLVIASVKPIHAVKKKPAMPVAASGSKVPTQKVAAQKASAQKVAAQKVPAKAVKQTPIKIGGIAPIAPPNTSAPSKAANHLDGSWDRKISRGALIPDVSVDLHGSGLASAYGRLDGALEQAIAHNMRVILLVTGKVRSHDRASGTGRGAIASVVRDWLAASRHASSISAVRNAHPRHGGTGALYIILKR
jgi:DNA-nicking Smr family endonuclease